MRKPQLDLSIILPCLHEADNLRLLLPELVKILRTLEIRWEILVIDGDPTDGTQEVVRAVPDAHYFHEPQKGYGPAILRGIREASGTYVMTMDADLSHPAEFVSRLWAFRDPGTLVIASRYTPGGAAHQPWTRLQLSKILNWFFRKGLSLDVLDLTSGYRLYPRRMFSNLQLEHSNFVIVVELLLAAYQKGMRVLEVPFEYRPRHAGRSNAKVFAFGLEYLRLFRRMWSKRNSVEFPDYDWRAHNSRIWFQRYWQRKRHDIILRFAPPELNTCDVGCGSSHILSDLPRAVGVDLRFNKLTFMRRTVHKLIQGDGMGLPFPDNSFECVISSEIIEHIPDENGRHIDELVRILKPGGILVLGTPDYGGWQWPLIEWVYGKVAPGAYADEHVTNYTFQSLKQAIEARDCDVIDHDYICKAELIFKARKRGVPDAPLELLQHDEHLGRLHERHA